MDFADYFEWNMKAMSLLFLLQVFSTFHRWLGILGLVGISLFVGLLMSEIHKFAKKLTDGAEFSKLPYQASCTSEQLRFGFPCFCVFFVFVYLKYWLLTLPSLQILSKHGRYLAFIPSSKVINLLSSSQAVPRRFLSLNTFKFHMRTLRQLRMVLYVLSLSLTMFLGLKKTGCLLQNISCVFSKISSNSVPGEKTSKSLNFTNYILRARNLVAQSKVPQLRKSWEALNIKVDEIRKYMFCTRVK